MRKRVIPVLQIYERKLVKTRRFKNPKYIGDPINAVKIFNDKGVDELIVLDISASLERRKPDYRFIERVVSEAFMPLGYGGGIKTIEEMTNLFRTGIEKLSLNSVLQSNINLLREASDTFGSQSVVASVNINRGLWDRKKYFIFDHLKMRNTNQEPAEFLKMAEKAGAGEVLLTVVNDDGEMNGYDIATIKTLAKDVGVPMVVMGGGGSLNDISNLLRETDVSAAAAASLFVYHGPHRAVLINYPEERDLVRMLHG
jgi:cyclase